MIGLFDSGQGGRNTLAVLCEVMPTADIVYLIDSENAPYGTKSVSELCRICRTNIDRLLLYGADTVLIGCCTASTVHPYLDKKYRRFSVPIIKPVARAAARATRNGKICVLATEHTVRSGCFRRAIPGCDVCAIAAQELVTFIDRGMSDDNITESGKRYLKRLIARLEPCGADTLVLGCTHFPAVIETVRELAKPLGINSVISSAREGALELVRGYRHSSLENGRISKLESVRLDSDKV